ncbi:hypothetical protein [Acidovorax sp.]|uniref:hypothetical protein n=1 Tax=Acidovorax sp. TaxID=1872122 RepID=UPI0027BAB58E|nr:hypothetical protein [Acidovorax sp.]
MALDLVALYLAGAAARKRGGIDKPNVLGIFAAGQLCTAPLQHGLRVRGGYWLERNECHGYFAPVLVAEKLLEQGARGESFRHRPVHRQIDSNAGQTFGNSALAVHPRQPSIRH